MPSSLQPHHHYSTKDLEMNKTVIENVNLNFFFLSEEWKSCSWTVCWNVHEKRIGFKCANSHFGFYILVQHKLTWESEVIRGSFSTGHFLNHLKNACMLMIAKDSSNSLFLWSSMSITLSPPTSCTPLLLEEAWDPRGSAQQCLEIGFFCGVTGKEFQKHTHLGILNDSGKSH